MLFFVACSVSISGCLVGEWNSYALRNPNTGEEAACAVPWGGLSAEWNTRLYQCIAACHERGFEVVNPERLPEQRPPVEAAPASVPGACLRNEKMDATR